MFEKLAKRVTGLFNDSSAASSKFLAEIFREEVTGPRPARNASGFLQAYNTHPWIRAVEHRIARDVAALQWKVFARRAGNARTKRGKIMTMEDAVAGGGKWSNQVAVKFANKGHREKWYKDVLKAGELVEIEDHLALQVLHSPNSFFSGALTRQLITIYADILGEAPLLKERNGAGKPIGLWPIPPHWVTQLATFQRPEFGITFGGKGAESAVPETEVLWIVDPNPHNPYLRGSGVIFSLADEADASEAISKYKRGFFYNSARPDFIVEIDGLGKREIQRYALGWNAQHQGFWRSFKAQFVNKAMKIHEIGTANLRDLDLSQLTRDERDIFIQVIGIPPEKMMVIENSNKATSLAADITMAKDVIQPRAEFQRGHFQDKLMPEYDERLILDYESPMPLDPEFRLEAAVANPATLRIDEWRGLQGYDDLEDGTGQRFLVSSVGQKTIESFDEMEQEDIEIPTDPFGNVPPAPGNDDPDDDDE